MIIKADNQFIDTNDIGRVLEPILIDSTEASIERDRYLNSKPEVALVLNSCPLEVYWNFYVELKNKNKYKFSFDVVHYFKRKGMRNNSIPVQGQFKQLDPFVRQVYVDIGHKRINLLKNFIVHYWNKSGTERQNIPQLTLNF